MGLLDMTRIDRKLLGTVFHGRLHHFPVIDSTNTRAVADAQGGSIAGVVYIADEQTAGRGRGGHLWRSTPGEGLYMSLLLRPALPADEALKLSLAMALVAQGAIQATTGVVVDLRWPNDLVTAADGRKLGGILTESASDPAGRLRYAVIGIGINLNQADFGEDLNRSATSLRMEGASRVDREEMISALLVGIAGEVSALERGDGSLLHRFAEASSWVRGKRVQVAEDDGYTGVTNGLTEQGLLRVLCADGQSRIVRHGGVRELIP